MTRELKGMVMIISIYLLGQIISRLIGGFMPGNVLGMFILFGLLQYNIVKEEDIKGVCNFILKNMLVLFIPISVGIIVNYQLIANDWLSLITIVILSTILVMVVVGHLQQYLSKRWEK